MLTVEEAQASLLAAALPLTATETLPADDALGRWITPPWMAMRYGPPRSLREWLYLFPNQSSGVLTSLAWADGLVDVDASVTVAPGDPVRFIPLAELLS